MTYIGITANAIFILEKIYHILIVARYMILPQKFVKMIWTKPAIHLAYLW